MRSLIIHMSSASGRQPNVARLLQNLPGAQVVEAVRGADVLAAEGADIRPGDLYRPRYPFRVSPGELGCFLSHRACWSMIAEGADDFALIVEDDFEAAPVVWPDVMRLVSRHASAESYIRLPAKAREVPGDIVGVSGSARLFLPRRIGLQTVAQVVGRNAAARLLRASEAIDRPVDSFLQMHWITGQPVHTILPNGVQELTDALGGSTIQKKSPAGGKLAREWKRAVYRARVAMHPQRAR